MNQRLPFNWNCPVGYLIAISLEWTLLAYVCFTILILVVSGIAVYLFATTIIKDIKSILKVIDKNSRIRKNRKTILKQLIEFIDLHSAIRQLSCAFYLLVFERVVVNHVSK